MCGKSGNIYLPPEIYSKYYINFSALGSPSYKVYSFLFELALNITMKGFS